jgi:hypothetical protein
MWWFVITGTKRGGRSVHHKVPTTPGMFLSQNVATHGRANESVGCEKQKVGLCDSCQSSTSCSLAG